MNEILRVIVPRSRWGKGLVSVKDKWKRKSCTIIVPSMRVGNWNERSMFQVVERRDHLILAIYFQCEMSDEGVLSGLKQ